MLNFINKVKILFEQKVVKYSVIAFLFLSVTFITQFLYVSGELRGEFNHYFLTSSLFGVPPHLMERGIQPHTQGWQNTGWDGQFYYFIANDPIDLKNSSKNIDSPAYRYQRIGMPIAAFIVSKLFFQDWVPPWLFYLTNFSVILIALFLLANHLSSIDISPYWALLWGLGVGTQLTLSRGLPDAFADAMLIIGIILYFRKFIFLSVLALLFAALSRETYLVIPIIFWMYNIFYDFKEKRSLFFSKTNLFLFVPLFFLLWQLWLRIHFGQSPSQAAMSGGILDFVPFRTWLRMFWGSLKGGHPLGDSYEWKLLLSYAGLYILTAISVGKYIFQNKTKQDKLLALNLAFVPILGLYACFGQTVLHHYSGYFKAATVFFVINLFNLNIFEDKKRKLVLVLLPIFGFLPFKIQFSMAKSYPGSAFYEYGSYWEKNIKTVQQECAKPKFEYELQEVNYFNRLPFSEKILNRPYSYLLKIKVKSEHNISLIRNEGKGKVYFQFYKKNDNGDFIYKESPIVLLNDIINSNEFVIVMPVQTELNKHHAGIIFKQTDCEDEVLSDLKFWESKEIN